MRFSFDSEGIAVAGVGPLPAVIKVVERLFDQLNSLPSVEVYPEDHVQFSIVMTGSGSPKDYDDLPLYQVVIVGGYPCTAFIPCFDANEFVSDFLTLLGEGFRLK